jgi:hypothetical protein
MYRLVVDELHVLEKTDFQTVFSTCRRTSQGGMVQSRGTPGNSPQPADSYHIDIAASRTSSERENTPTGLSPRSSFATPSQSPSHRPLHSVENLVGRITEANTAAGANIGNSINPAICAENTNLCVKDHAVGNQSHDEDDWQAVLVRP